MKLSILLLSSLFLLRSVFAKDKLETIVLNSPVKETFLKVKLGGFDGISGVSFKPKNGGTEQTGEIAKEGSTFIGKLKVSTLRPGDYEFRVKVRLPSGKSPKDETASVSFISFKIDASLEVADPGEEGKKTLLGIDSDKDGVRDDVQRWINESYPMNLSPSTNQALKQNAKILQIMIQNSDNRALARQAQDKSLEAASCLWWIRGVRNQIYQNSRAIFFNTLERIQANFKVETYSRGASSPATIKSLDIDEHYKLCDFQATKEK